jgi:RNA polymerase primary sigma factor
MTGSELPGSALTQYVREISAYPLLTAEQEISLARQMSEGKDGGEARQRLVQSNLRLVVSVARQYQGHGLSLLDLIQEGNIGLQNGVDRFEWRKGCRLSTYVYWWIRQAITRALANDSRTIRLPVHVGELLRRAARAEQSLEIELGRPPSQAEIAGRIDIDPERLRLIRMAAATPASLDLPLRRDPTRSRADALVDEDSALVYDDGVDTADLHRGLMSVVNRLPERERDVLKLRFGLDTPGAHTLEEIGRSMGVSRERARQLENQAMRRLRSNVDLQRDLVELTGT